jgi:hypothetical protein
MIEKVLVEAHLKWCCMFPLSCARFCGGLSTERGSLSDDPMMSLNVPCLKMNGRCVDRFFEDHYFEVGCQTRGAYERAGMKLRRVEVNARLLVRNRQAGFGLLR